MAIDIGKISVTPKGVYNTSTNYERLDIVTHDGSSYISLIDNNTLPLNNINAWQLNASKGSKGETGYKTIDPIFISPTDLEPTIEGTYKPQITSMDNIDSDPINYGTLYPNINNFRAKEGYDTLFNLENGVWKKYETKLVDSIDFNENLIDESKITLGYVGSTGSLNDTDVSYRKLKIKQKGNTKYTFTVLSDYYIPSQSKNLVFFDSLGNFISRLAITQKVYTYTTPANTAYAYTNYYVEADGDNLSKIGNYNMSLFEGDYKLGSTNLTSYNNLKNFINSEQLIKGDDIVVVSGDIVFKTNVLENNKISENIVIDGYDFAKLDLNNNKILATNTLACIARSTNGTWGLINDNDHSKKGIINISNNTNSFIINYDKIYSKILSLTVVTDETYAKYGISVGSSAGNGYSQVFFYGNRVDGIIGNNLTIESRGYLNGLTSISETSGTITIVHSEISDSIPIIMINQPYNIKIVSFNDTSFIFELYNAGTKITDFSNININFVRNGSRALTNTEMAIPGSNFWIQALMEQEIDLI